MSETILNNYSDDSQIKRYMSEKLAPLVFHNIPLNVLNTGMFSLINEYISQATEQMAFTSSFYLNESFITKAILPDSIYAEAAIFGIGYAFATPSATNLLLELKLEDIYKNAKENINGFMEFILDKNTKFNLTNGNVYSLDYDISIQYKTIETSRNTAKVPAWNVQYTNLDEMNSIAINKNIYIPYRVTDQWLCLFVNVSEFERQTYTIPCNMANGIANEDRVITCRDHICGFDIRYIKSDGSYEYIQHDHILPMHSTVNDMNPYIHYIMDNQQSIRFMFQLQGNNYFKPELNSLYEITMYTCHGKAANFTKYDETEQPKVLTSGRRYSNNGNVLKAAFVIGASMGGTNIGTAENVRRKTIEAYNTANVLSTDHDIEEWLKTFYFENVLYPFFFKRRDDPWGRIWSGYLALKDSDDYVFKTNTLHAQISYDALYHNENNIASANEIIIPPGWLWKYKENDRHTVVPFIQTGNKIETANTLTRTNEPYMFSNPFGIRIQKKPFAIGYFNPWINQYITTSKLNTTSLVYSDDEKVSLYHATPLYVHIQRTYTNNYYKLSTYIDPTIPGLINGQSLIKNFKQSNSAPVFPELTWGYFHRPLNPFASIIPLSVMNKDTDGDVIFDPDTTYLCVRNRNAIIENGESIWNLSEMWISDETDPDNIRRIDLNISGELDYIYGLDLWDDNRDRYQTIYVSGDTTIRMDANSTIQFVDFDRVDYRDYYDMKLRSDIQLEINDIVRPVKISKVTIISSYAKKTNKTKTQHSESSLYDIGQPTRDKNGSVAFTITYEWYYDPDETDSTERITGEVSVTYKIQNSKRVCIPYAANPRETENHMYEFVIGNGYEQLDPDTVILYADMHPSPDSNTVDYYKFPFSNIPNDVPIIYIKQHALPVEENNMRVVLKANINGSLTGYVEMTPIRKDNDGTYLFETDMYPLNQLLDVDNLIHIASLDVGGGDWKSISQGSSVPIDALNPELVLTILLKNDHLNGLGVVPSRIVNDTSYEDYLVIDEYSLDDFSLVQELKEMRSVVKFGSPTDTSEGIEVQQVPFVEYTLMTNANRFPSFVSTFVNVHKALEPVIFKRLEGNNYLDCKLIATYGLPHSYTSDQYNPYENPDQEPDWWPDLNIQLEFDVKLFNNALYKTTFEELQLIIKSYFNRLTSLHTATDLTSIDNNIYISHIIQRMESHANVAYLKFKGWYTDQRNKSNGHFMDATHQAIVQLYPKLEDMPKQMLEYYVPEMFTLDADTSIVLNLVTVDEKLKWRS